MASNLPEHEMEQLRVLFDLVAQHFEAGDLEQAEEVSLRLRDFLADLTALHPDDQALWNELASAHYNLGNLFSQTQRFDESEAAYRAALPIQDRLVTEHPAEAMYRNHLARCRFNLGNTLLALERFVEADECFRGAQPLWSGLVEEDPETPEYQHDLARSHFNRAYVLAGLERPAEAQGSYRAAREVWRKMLDTFDPDPAWEYDLARASYNLGMSLASTQHLQDAVRVYHEALVLFEKLHTDFPENDGYLRDLYWTNRELVGLCAHLGQVEETRLAFRGEVAARQEQISRNPTQDSRRELARRQLALAGWFEQSRHVEASAEFYRAARATLEEILAAGGTPQDEHLLAATIYDTGILFRENHRPDSAEECYRRALRLWQEQLAGDPGNALAQSQIGSTINHLGILYFDTGRLDQAVSAYEEALAIREERLTVAPDDLDNLTYLGGSLCNLGNVAGDRRDLNAARDYYRRSVEVLERVLRRQPNHGLAKSFLVNARRGQEWIEKSSAQPPDPHRFQTATIGWRQSGPEPQVHPSAGGSWEDLLAQLEQRDDATAWRDRADVLRWLGRAEEAEQAIDEALRCDPDDAGAWYVRGLILAGYLNQESGEAEPFDHARHESAVAAFDEALLREENHTLARRYKARTLVHLGHATQAGFRALSSAVQGMSAEEAEEYLRPVRRTFQYFFDRTRDAFDTALRLDPDSASTYREKGQFLVDMTSELAQEKEQLFRKAVALDPSLSDAWYQLARLVAARNERPEAEAILQRALTLDPGLRERARRDFPWATLE
jgi:tetratricopeptide (TPR) repeat protein